MDCVVNHQMFSSACVDRSAIETAKHGNTFGLILGTLGRQGNVNIMRRLKEKLQKRGKRYIVVLLSEIYPQKVGDSGSSTVLFLGLHSAYFFEILNDVTHSSNFFDALMLGSK